MRGGSRRTTQAALKYGPRYGWWSRFLGSHGVVRWVDLYGGIEWLPGLRRFEGYWMSFEQFLGYYNIPLHVARA